MGRVRRWMTRTILLRLFSFLNDRSKEYLILLEKEQKLTRERERLLTEEGLLSSHPETRQVFNLLKETRENQSNTLLKGLTMQETEDLQLLSRRMITLLGRKD